MKLSVALVTGSSGLVGSESARWFASKGLSIAGIDNDMRRTFFGDGASTDWQRERLVRDLGEAYHHHAVDIRDAGGLERVFRRYGASIELVIHAAAQPSHDWAAKDPVTDFTVNANGTLNLLQATRDHAPEAVFVFVSTNKVYGDAPNRLPLEETALRWEVDARHRYADGIDESMSVDQTLHSLFGASKLAADLLVQEFGRYFGLRSASFRCGCLTGPNHSGAQLHGFLAYLMQCAATGGPFTVFGYKGKQVRDNLHSADLVQAFHEFFKAPRAGEVYNLGGGRFSNCSMREAIRMCQEITGREMDWSYSERNRTGDHIWWISANGKFSDHYPEWRVRHDVPRILGEMYERNRDRWRRDGRAAPRGR